MSIHAQSLLLFFNFTFNVKVLWAGFSCGGALKQPVRLPAWGLVCLP